MTCEEVQRELSSYLDRELPVELCEKWLSTSATASCAPLSSRTRAMSCSRWGDERLVDVPHGYTTRLYRKLKAHLQGSAPGDAVAVSPQIPLGITADGIDLGSHLIYFWQSEEEFAQGVRFLEPGLLGEDHCVVFGHEEATERVFR